MVERAPPFRMGASMDKIDTLTARKGKRPGDAANAEPVIL